MNTLHLKGLIQEIKQNEEKEKRNKGHKARVRFDLVTFRKKIQTCVKFGGGGNEEERMIGKDGRREKGVIRARCQ